MKKLCAFIGALFVVCAVVTPLIADEPATQPAASDRVTLYAAVVKPGPAWRAAEEKKEKLDMSRHFAYVTKLRDEGKIVMGGPFGDGSGGLIVFRAGSMEEAKTFIANDPATIEKIFESDLHPWLVNAADLRG